MKKGRTFLTSTFLMGTATLASLLIGSNQSSYADAPVKVEAAITSSEVVGKVDERVYSHFLEHIYNSCNGGLWGDLVWNRSLEAGKTSGWSFENGVIKQDSTANDCRLILGADKEGSDAWTDYDIRVTAKKISGSEGFLVMFRVSPDGKSYYWLNLGGWQNRYVGIEKETPKSNGRKIIGGQKAIPEIEVGEVYDIRILVVGQNIKVFVNQELIHEIVDFDEDAPKSGCVGVGTWNTKAEFGSVLVRDLRRRTLYDLRDDNLKLKSPVDVRYWTVEGDAAGRTGDARNSSRYVRFNGKGSLAQADYALKEGETYDYSFWTRGKGAVSFGVVEENKPEKFDVDSNEWVKKTGVFTVGKTYENASISLNFAPGKGGFLDVDQVSVFPRSWKEQTGGLRPDLLQAIADIRPTLIRWPGGCYASAYRWKSGVGPQDDRVAYPIELWNDVDVNSFGIDEFMTLCTRVGADPIMVVDIGTEQWIRQVGDPALRNVDWLQEVCDWVEYCNGDVSTKWGAERAKNGHPEPYGVKYWEIDNEVVTNTTPPEKYAQIINELVPRMKAIDPSITIIGCGSFMGDRKAWDSTVVRIAGKNIDFLSTHRYDDPNGFAVNPWENQRFFESLRETFANSDNPNIKIFNSEWNAQSTDWRTGLHAGGFLNCCEHASDVIGIAAPALFMRHKSATGWDNAFINFDANRWYPAPNYVVMKLWRDSYAPNVVKLTSDSPELNGKNPVINAVATKSENGKSIYVKIVNNLPQDVQMDLTFDVDLDKTAVGACVVTPEIGANEDAKAKLSKRNTLENPNAIAPQGLNTTVADGKVSFVAPSYSAIVIQVAEQQL